MISTVCSGEHAALARRHHYHHCVQGKTWQMYLDMIYRGASEALCCILISGPGICSWQVNMILKSPVAFLSPGYFPFLSIHDNFIKLWPNHNQTCVFLKCGILDTHRQPLFLSMIFGHIKKKCPWVTRPDSEGTGIVALMFAPKQLGY